jgi:hypothetical protein
MRANLRGGRGGGDGSLHEVETCETGQRVDAPVDAIGNRPARVV